jgi:hypothetical protein
MMCGRVCHGLLDGWNRIVGGTRRSEVRDKAASLLGRRSNEMRGHDGRIPIQSLEHDRISLGRH